MKRSLVQIPLFLFILLLNMACSAEVIAPPTATIIPTSTPLPFVTATLISTRVPYSSPTVESTPSAIPVIGTTSQGEDQGSITEATLDGVQASPTKSEPIPSVVPTPTYGAAPQDGDSAEAPAVNITLSESSTPFLQHSSQLSYPEGDAEDWVKFALEGKQGQEQIVSVVLHCSGSGGLNLELLQNGVPLQKWEEIGCGQPSQLHLYLYVSAPYILRLSPTPGRTSLKYISYSLTMQLMK